jgi:hypothetical protein
MSYSNRGMGALSGKGFSTSKNSSTTGATTGTTTGTTPSKSTTTPAIATTTATPEVALSKSQSTAMTLGPVQADQAAIDAQKEAARAKAVETYRYIRNMGSKAESGAKIAAAAEQAASDRSAAASFASVLAAECTGILARDASLPKWEPPPGLLPAGAFVAYVAAVVKWDDATAGSDPARRVMQQMAYPGPGYEARLSEAGRKAAENQRKFGPQPNPNWRYLPVHQEFADRQQPGVKGTVADISDRIAAVTSFWFERAGDAASRGALVMVVQLKKEANTDALTAWVQVNLAQAMRDNGMSVGGTVLPLPVLLSFKSWADKDAQAQIADAVERVRRSLGQLATAFKVNLQGVTAIKKKLDGSALKLRKVVDEVQAGITTSAGVQAFVAEITGGVPSMVAQLDALPATVTEIAQLEGARASLANAAKAIDALEAKIAKDAASIQLAISRGPTIGQEMTALKAEYTPAKVIAIAMPEAEALASRAPFAEQAERVRCSAMSILQQQAGNAFDSLQRATARAVEVSATLDVPGLTASLGALGGLGSAVAELRAAAAKASAALDAKEKELGLDWYLRNFYGLPVWAWGAGGAALLVGGAVFIRSRRKKLAASTGQK